MPTGPLLFDATITLFSHHLAGSQLEGLPRWAVVEMVGRAVRAVPGARWIDVEAAGGTLPEAVRHRGPLDRLYAVGSSAVPEGAEWDAVRERVEAAITNAQVYWEAEERPAAVAHPALSGLRRWFRNQRAP